MNNTSNNSLARAIQDAVPFVERPFRALAEQLGTSEGAVIDQLLAWKEEKKLREISAVLEGSSFGYESALCTAKIPLSDIERVASVVSTHPTVTHNYERVHSYNLWFTIAVPHEMGLAQTLSLLAREAECPRFFALRRTHTFKIGVNFDLESRMSSTEKKLLSAPPVFVFSPRELAMLRALQTPLPLVEKPFAELSARACVSETDLLSFARSHLGTAIRRYVGTFHHRKLGVSGNGMAVWNVRDEQIVEAGERMAAAKEVSHCYSREAIEGFPYRLYSMLHGPNEEACRDVAARLSCEVSVDDYLVLFSTREFKKCRLRYFLPELDEWWNARVGASKTCDASK